MISIKVYLRTCSVFNIHFKTNNFRLVFILTNPNAVTASSGCRPRPHIGKSRGDLRRLIFFTSLVAVPCIGSLKSFPFLHWLGQLWLLLTSLAACSAACKRADARRHETYLYDCLKVHCFSTTKAQITYHCSLQQLSFRLCLTESRLRLHANSFCSCSYFHENQFPSCYRLEQQLNKVAGNLLVFHVHLLPLTI